MIKDRNRIYNKKEYKKFLVDDKFVVYKFRINFRIFFELFYFLKWFGEYWSWYPVII